MYELYYSDGGHGGPYDGYETACDAAERHIKGIKGRKVYVEIRPRALPVIGGYGSHHGSTMVWIDDNGELQVKHI